MKSGAPDRSTNKRGPYTLVPTPGGTSLSVDVGALEVHAKRFSATWFDVIHDSESVALCFGQRIGDRLLSRLDVRFSREQFVTAMESLLEFAERSLTVARELVPEEWKVASNYPESHKYLTEDATVMGIAVAGSRAEVAFYWVPASDMHHAMNGGREYRFTGPQSVVTVGLTAGQLRWMLTQSFGLVRMLKEEG